MLFSCELHYPHLLGFQLHWSLCWETVGRSVTLAIPHPVRPVRAAPDPSGRPRGSDSRSAREVRGAWSEGPNHGSNSRQRSCPNKEVRFPTWQNWTGHSRKWLFGMPILVLESRHFLMVKSLHTMGLILLISLLLEVDAHFKAAKPNSIELTLPRKDLRWSRADVQFYSTTGIGQVFLHECTTFLLDRLHLRIYLEDQNLALLCWEGPSV